MSNSTSHSNQDIQAFVDAVKVQVPASSEVDSRGVERQKVTIYAVIRTLDGMQEISAVTRDISSDGVGLITNEPVTTGLDYGLEFSGDSAADTGPNKKVCAECIWCFEIGESLWISGWKLIGVL